MRRIHKVLMKKKMNCLAHFWSRVNNHETCVWGHAGNCISIWETPPFWSGRPGPDRTSLPRIPHCSWTPFDQISHRIESEKYSNVLLRADIITSGGFQATRTTFVTDLKLRRTNWLSLQENGLIFPLVLIKQLFMATS